MVRIKHRYLLITVLYPTKATSKANHASSIPDLIHFHRPSPPAYDEALLKKLIIAGVADLFGDYGLGLISSSLKILYHSPATSTSIVRVTRESFRIVWTALTFTTELPRVRVPCVVRVIRVSGTIRKSEEGAVEYAKALIRRVKGGGDGYALEAVTKAAAVGGSGGMGGDVMDVDDEDDEDSDG